MTSPLPALGKQQRKTLATRRKICQATVDSLARYGYQRTSIARVVEMAGVTPGALQHHFPAKEDLIVATADYLLEGSFARMRRFAATEGPAAEVLANFFRGMWNNLINTEAYRALVEILVASRTDTALHRRITPTLHQWNKAIDEVVVEIFESIGGDESDVEMVMLMTRSLMRGLVLHEGYGDIADTGGRAVERWIELITPFLRLRPAKTV